jgi:hypothetical protein
MKTPGGRSIAMRQTMSRSEMSLIDDYQKMLKGVAKFVASRKRFEFPNGHTLTVCPADEWDRYGSMEFVSFYIQEAQEVDFRIFDTLVSRLRNSSGVVNGIPYFRGYLCARGVKREHWIYKEYVGTPEHPIAWDGDSHPSTRSKVKKPDWTYLKFKTYDNQKVLDAIAPGYIQAQLVAHKDHVAWIKMQIDGEFGFDIEGRSVFECYRPEMHDAEILEDPSLPILRGWDFGYNRPAVTWSQYTREGRFLVLKEFCPVGMGLQHVCENVQALQKSWFPTRLEHNYRDYGDATGDKANDTGIESLEFVENFFTTAVETRKARINVGLEILRNLMSRLTRKGEPRFAVDYSCERLRDALGGAYYYRTDKTDESPIKGEGYDDVVDSVRYVSQLVVEEVFERQIDRPRSSGAEAFASY